MSVWEKEGRKESELEVLRKHTSISRRPFAHPSPLERGTKLEEVTGFTPVTPSSCHSTAKQSISCLVAQHPAAELGP